MKITAHLHSRGASHDVAVTTAGHTQRVGVGAKAHGGGSAVNGGEFLMLALATCYCNDLYREAARLNLPLDAVEVEACADFDGVGLAAKNIEYRARIESAASANDIARLIQHTDTVAEVHNTVRAGVPVTLQPWRSTPP